MSLRKPFLGSASTAIGPTNSWYEIGPSHSGLGMGLIFSMLDCFRRGAGLNRVGQATPCCYCLAASHHRCHFAEELVCAATGRLGYLSSQHHSQLLDPFSLQ